MGVNGPGDVAPRHKHGVSGPPMLPACGQAPARLLAAAARGGVDKKDPRICRRTAGVVPGHRRG